MNNLYKASNIDPAYAISWTYYNDVNLNNNKSFSISFPSDWKLENYSLQESKLPLILGLIPPSNPLDYSSKLTIGIEKSDVETNLTKYTNQVIKLLKNRLDGLEILDSVPVTFSGKQGEHILYTYSLDNRKIQVMQTWLKDGIETYIFTFATKPDYYQYFVPIVNDILKSFVISPPELKTTNISFEKFNTFVFPDMFEIQFPHDWRLDQKNNRISIISPVSGYSDRHLERLDIYFSNSVARSNSAYSNSSISLNSELFSELDYIKKTLRSPDLISITTFNHSQGLIKVLTYTYESNIGPTYVREYLFDTGQKRATLVFSASIDEYSAVLPIVTQMVKGFEFR